MIITKKLIEKYLNFTPNMEYVAGLLDRAGIICSTAYFNDEAYIKIEVPSTRPDCNSVAGVFREIEALLNYHSNIVIA